MLKFTNKVVAFFIDIMKNYRRLIFCYVLFCLILPISSCDSEEKNNLTAVSNLPDYNKNFFTSAYLINQSFYSISFPNWFNATMIDNNAIASLKIVFFQVSTDFEDSLQITSDVEFNFEKDGRVSKMISQQYYEGVSLGKETFKYNESPDNYGYSLPIISPRKSFINKHKKDLLLDMVIELEAYDRLEKIESNEKNIMFKNTLRSNEDLYVFILDTLYWNVVYVDELIKKTGPNTTFCYGNPKQPVECFQLNNLVEKTNLKSTVFYDAGYPKRTVKKVGAFNHIKRYFYDSVGRFDYTLENIFASNGTYIEQKKYSIEYNNDDLPVNFLVFSGVDSLNLKQQTKFEFTYKFREGI